MKAIEMSGVKDTTVVGEKDLPQTPMITYTNLPEDAEAARVRIMELELALGDLVRACELATVCRNLDLFENFAAIGEDKLKNKIEIVYPDMGPMNIVVIEDDAQDNSGAETYNPSVNNK